MATHTAMTTEKTRTKHTVYAPCGEYRRTVIKNGKMETTGPIMVATGKRPSCEACRAFGSFEASL